MLQRTRTTTRSSAPRVTLLLLVCAVFANSALTFEAQAKQKNQKNQPTTGRIEVSTNPAGYPVIIDDNPAGETTEFARAIELAPGPHTVRILFPNNTVWAHAFNIVAGRKDCIALNYRPRPVNIQPLAVSPCPYPVNVSAPATANDGDVITFSADVAYQGPSALNYTWTVSPPMARIVSGAGTPTITVDSSGLGNRRVTAILVADDGSGDRNCRQTAQAMTGIVTQTLPAQLKRFDEFPSIAFDDDKARLDNMAIELQNNPGATAYIISYAGRTSRVGTADGMGARARGYLTDMRGISSSRLVTVNGGYRETNTYELWLVPAGAEAPRPTPTLQPNDVRPAPAAPSRRLRH